MEVLDGSARAATDPMRGLHFDQLAEDDLLGGLFGNLTEHGRRRWLMIIEAATRHTPAASYRGATGVFGGEQSATRCHNCVRREALPDNGAYDITEYQADVASLSAYRRTWLVDHWTYQQPEDQLTSARPIGVDRTDNDKTTIEREHVGIGAVLEECLERMPTMFSDSDDQHLVIISQNPASDAAVDIALDGRADVGYQVLCWAVRQHWHSQHIAAHQQAKNL